MSDLSQEVEKQLAHAARIHGAHIRALKISVIPALLAGGVLTLVRPHFSMWILTLSVYACLVVSLTTLKPPFRPISELLAAQQL